MWRFELWEFDRLGIPAEQQTWDQGQDCGLWGDFSTANSICIIIVLILIIIYNPHYASHLSSNKKKALKDGCSLFTTALLARSTLQMHVKAAIREAKAFLKSAFRAVHW